MRIDTKFNLGDHVHIISLCSAWKRGVCPTCSGETRIVVSGETFQCPRCKGDGADRDYKSRWYVNESGTVRLMDARVTEPGAEAHDANTVRLMFNSSGSGSMYREDDAFLTRAEADAECNARNGNDAHDVWTRDSYR